MSKVGQDKQIVTREKVNSPVVLPSATLETNNCKWTHPQSTSASSIASWQSTMPHCIESNPRRHFITQRNWMKYKNKLMAMSFDTSDYISEWLSSIDETHICNHKKWRDKTIRNWKNSTAIWPFICFGLALFGFANVKCAIKFSHLMAFSPIDFRFVCHNLLSVYYV